MAVSSEFIAAVNQICSERGIDPESVYAALESAVLVAYKKEYDKQEAENLSVELDRGTGEFKVIAKKVVVEKVSDKDTEVSLEDAQAFDPDLAIGDALEIELPIEEFGRIAAQTAKQVILQGIRESEKDAILKEYSGRIGEVFTALMQRMQRGNVVFEIGKATALMPPEEQVQSEFYRLGERYKVMLKSIEDSEGSKELIVSRSDAGFLKALFMMEVPEIESGIVEVKEIARESGSRSKMAVISHQDGVDAIGSCVGQRGVRIANVMSELGEEKIDIIEWNENIEQFVANALSPAQVDSVKVDGEIAVVKVPEDQLSLAIGRDGQNVRLAAKLTGLKIDIQGPNGPVQGAGAADDNAGDDTSDDGSDSADEKDKPDAKKAKSTKKTAKKAAKKAAKAEKASDSKLSASLAKKLEKSGTSIEDAAKLSVEELMNLEGIGKVTAEKIYKELN